MLSVCVHAPCTNKQERCRLPRIIIIKSTRENPDGKKKEVQA